MSIQGSSMPIISPMLEKIGEKLTSAHITTLIKNSENDSIRETDEKKQIRKHNFLILIAVLSFIFALCILMIFTNNQEMLFK